MRFFPEPDSSEIAPFTHAFLHMMFAHVEFERRIADLAVVITLDPGFGETKATIWSAKERPEKFDKLCSDNQSKHPGGLPEADAIVRCSRQGVTPLQGPELAGPRRLVEIWCEHRRDRRARRAHSRWRTAEPRVHRRQIQRVADSFIDVEIELWKLQSAIEHRLPREPMPPELSEPK